MMSNRHTSNWALGVLTVSVAPLWIVACSSDDVAPQSVALDSGTVTGVGGMATSTSGGQSTDSPVTTSLTNGSTSAGDPGSTSAAGVGGTTASTTGAAQTSGGDSTSTTTSVGGAAVGGSGGMTTTGVAGSAAETTTGSGGGTTTPSTDPDASAGCGSAATDVCDVDGSPCVLNGLDFYVDLPDDYDSMRPYPVVFQYHPLGGTAEGARTMYRVRPNFPDAIYVSPEGSDNGFPNTGGVDEDMTRAIMADIEAKYCVDRARYFATGFSYGGSMSYTAGCNMSDVFRAIAAMSGAPISGATCTSQVPERPVAVWATHGSEDTALPITMAEPIIESFVQNNGCTTETEPVDPSPCVAYQGCQEGYPVVWCRREGDPHAIPDFAAAAISDFFQQF